MTECTSAFELLGEPLRTVVVGVGKRGRKHASIIERCPATILAGICDSCAAARSSFTGAICTSADAVRLLSETAVSAAVMAVSHDSYMPMVAHYLAKGVTCLKEKPLARSLSEANQIEQLAAVGAGKLAIATQRRHGDVLRAVRDILDSASRPPVAFEYVYTLGLTPGERDWRSSRTRAGGGAILDMGYHVIDFLTTLLGVPTSVSAFNHRQDGSASDTVENGATIILNYEGGTSGTVIVSRYLSPETERATFWLEDETLHFDGRSLTAMRGDERRWLADAQSGEELMHRQLHAFIRLHADEPSLSCDVTSARETMQTIELCYQALGGRIAHAPFNAVPQGLSSVV